MSKGIDWPKKTRELHIRHFDSAICNDLLFRNDDIIVGTYAKSGASWPVDSTAPS